MAILERVGRCQPQKIALSPSSLAEVVASDSRLPRLWRYKVLISRSSLKIQLD
jgi:hypothetical protein